MCHQLHEFMSWGLAFRPDTTRMRIEMPDVDLKTLFSVKNKKSNIIDAPGRIKCVMHRIDYTTRSFIHFWIIQPKMNRQIQITVTLHQLVVAY